MATGRIGTTPVLQVRWSKAPSDGTTSLSGLDDNSVSLVYSVGYEAVYRNGVLLSRGNDYTATDGTTVTLIDATITGDIIEIFANQTIPLSDTYSQTVSDGKFINNTLTTTTGDIIYASGANTPARLAIGTSADVLTVSGGIPAWAAPAASTPTFYGVELTHTGNNQVITNNTWTKVVWDLESYDSGGYASSGATITIPAGKGGYYLVIGWGYWDQSATGLRNMRIYKNGADVYINRGWITNATAYPTSTIQNVVKVVATDTLELYVFQSSGGNLNFYLYPEESGFSAALLGA
jgi:hypothetical protein